MKHDRNLSGKYRSDLCDREKSKEIYQDNNPYRQICWEFLILIKINLKIRR